METEKKTKRLINQLVLDALLCIWFNNIFSCYKVTNRTHLKKYRKRKRIYTTVHKFANTEKKTTLIIMKKNIIIWKFYPHHQCVYKHLHDVKSLAISYIASKLHMNS